MSLRCSTLQPFYFWLPVFLLYFIFLSFFLTIHPLNVPSVISEVCVQYFWILYFLSLYQFSYFALVSVLVGLPSSWVAGHFQQLLAPGSGVCFLGRGLFVGEWLVLVGPWKWFLGLRGAVCGVLSWWIAGSLNTGPGSSFWWQIDALPGQTQNDMCDVCGEWRWSFTDFHS